MGIFPYKTIKPSFWGTLIYGDLHIQAINPRSCTHSSPGRSKFGLCQQSGEGPSGGFIKKDGFEPEKIRGNHMRRSINGGNPQIIYFWWIFHYKPSILGCPLFYRKPPNSWVLELESRVALIRKAMSLLRSYANLDGNC